MPAVAQARLLSLSGLFLAPARGEAAPRLIARSGRGRAGAGAKFDFNPPAHQIWATCVK